MLIWIVIRCSNAHKYKKESLKCFPDGEYTDEKHEISWRSWKDYEKGEVNKR